MQPTSLCLFWFLSTFHLSCTILSAMCSSLRGLFLGPWIYQVLSNTQYSLFTTKLLANVLSSASHPPSLPPTVIELIPQIFCILVCISLPQWSFLWPILPLISHSQDPLIHTLYSTFLSSVFLIVIMHLFLYLLD